MLPFAQGFDVRSALEETRDVGYAFRASAMDGAVLASLLLEIRTLPLEAGDHLRHPINRGASNEVRQMHERAYRPLGHADVPAATALCRALASAAAPLLDVLPELADWLPNEVGYQRYRDGADRISPHRDRASDRLIGVTVTLEGAAEIRIHAAETDPPDYARVRQADAFTARAGTVLFLRAPGFGGGAQIIHEVCPPSEAPRSILNLRQRPTVLKPPAHTRWR